MTAKSPTLVLAPLQGLTDVTFRNIWAQHFTGLDQAIAPFISTMSQQRIKPARLSDVDLERNKRLHVIPQILGNVATDFIFLANALYDAGHPQVNWNLGCPHSKIAKKRRGSGLLPHPEMVDALLSRIVPEMKPRLTIKVRLGRKDKTEIYELLDVFGRHDIDEIILHPRTGEQMYTGTADLDAFEKVMKACPLPVMYNGDIVDLDSFMTVQNRLPDMQRFMIGRGMLSNPFLAEDIKGKAPESQDVRLQRLKDFHTDLHEAYARIFSGPGHLTGRMKGFWSYLGTSFQGHRKPLKKILKATTMEAYTDHVNAFFDLNLPFTPGKDNLE